MTLTTNQSVRSDPRYFVIEGGEYEPDDLVQCHLGDGIPLVAFRAEDIA